MENNAQRTYQKFLTSKQEPLRLSIALEEFSREELSNECREAYLSYLRRRLRPALKLLVSRDDSLTMGRLTRWISLTGDSVDYALAVAVAEGKISAMVWLLRWKQKNGGFPERELFL